jgi:hypothetical protein
MGNGTRQDLAYFAKFRRAACRRMNDLMGGMADFGGFQRLARSLQNYWHGRSDGPAT